MGKYIHNFDDTTFTLENNTITSSGSYIVTNYNLVVDGLVTAGKGNTTAGNLLLRLNTARQWDFIHATGSASTSTLGLKPATPGNKKMVIANYYRDEFIRLNPADTITLSQFEMLGGTFELGSNAKLDIGGNYSSSGVAFGFKNGLSDPTSSSFNIINLGNIAIVSFIIIVKPNIPGQSSMDLELDFNGTYTTVSNAGGGFSATMTSGADPIIKATDIEASFDSVILRLRLENTNINFADMTWQGVFTMEVT